MSLSRISKGEDASVPHRFLKAKRPSGTRVCAKGGNAASLSRVDLDVLPSDDAEVALLAASTASVSLRAGLLAGAWAADADKEFDADAAAAPSSAATAASLSSVRRSTPPPSSPSSSSSEDSEDDDEEDDDDDDGGDREDQMTIDELAAAFREQSNTPFIWLVSFFAMVSSLFGSTMVDGEEPFDSTPASRLLGDSEKKVILKALNAAVHHHLPPPLSKAGVPDAIPKKSVVRRRQPAESIYLHFLRHLKASGYKAFVFEAHNVFKWVTESLGNSLVANHVLEMFENIAACDASFWLLFVFKVGEQLETHEFDPLFGEMMALFMQFMQDSDNQELMDKMTHNESSPSLKFLARVYDEVEVDFKSIPEGTSKKGKFNGFDTFKSSSAKSDGGSVAANPNPDAYPEYLMHHKGIFSFIYEVFCFSAEHPDQMFMGLNTTEMYYLIRALFQSMTRSVRATQGFGLSQLRQFIDRIPAENLDLTRIYQRIVQMIILTDPISAQEWADEWFEVDDGGKHMLKSDKLTRDALHDGLSRALAGNEPQLHEMEAWVESYFAVKSKKASAQASSRSQLASNDAIRTEKPVESKRRTLSAAAPAAAGGGAAAAAAVHTPTPARPAAGGGGEARRLVPSHSKPVQPVVATKTKAERIKENKELLDAGFITEKDFIDAKAKILTE